MIIDIAAKRPTRIVPFVQKFIPIIVLAAALMAWPATSSAEVASSDEMHDVAQNWLTYIIDQTGSWGGATNPVITDVQDMIVNDTLLARYYGISSGGYIIVPALKELPPVKAYSDQYSLDIYEADGFALLLRQVLQHRTQLYAEVYGSLEASQPSDQAPLFDFKNHDKWNQLAVSPKDYTGITDKGTAALLEGEGPLLTTAWHQGSPYNNLCPMGDGGQCVVGCVATAAAQIQYYHKWPPQGEGSNSYRWNGDQSCDGTTPAQTLTADFSDDYVYDDSPAAVAEISYEMGVAFEMDYGYCGSGAYTLDGYIIFPTYYRYDSSARREYRANHTQESWFTLIQDDINKGHPILYRIYGHAIVCDGWRISGDLDQYHFNYGWGGSQNAWYTVDNLYCPWAGCDTMEEGMVIHIIPLNGSPWLTGSDFSDDFGGDGDGVLEGGETIAMTITVTNYGGAAVNDVSLNLSIDDASLTILDGSADLGSINAYDSATNSSDPFEFSIPADYLPRLDSFTIEVVWNGGTARDTLVVEKAVGRVSILLVDDDENGNRNEYYEECLQNIRVPYDIYEFAAFSTPDAAYLSNYDIVFWFTGDYRTYPISGPEIASMTGFMDNGGRLFLSGQAIAAELSSFDPTFLTNYLKTTYNSSLNIPVLSTQSGQVFDTGYMVAIQGSNSAGNQVYPDQVTPAGDGRAEMKYLSSNYFGAVSYSGDYQLLFFTFGFEAIVNGDSRWRDRDHIMSDILDFFDYQRPNGSPVVSGLTVAPGDPLHLLDHTPDIAWSYFDVESSPQTDYQVQVGTDDNWLVCEMWDSGPISGSETQITYDGLELIDGVTYYYRVRSFDGSLWSEWVSNNMRMNSVPAPATGLSPDSLMGVSTSTPVLSHTNAIDAEFDILTYAYEVYADSGLTTLVDQKSGQPSGGSTTSWTVSVSLNDDSIYYWRVRGSDPYEAGLWSEAASFWVNSINLPPQPFDLVSPANGAGIPGLTATFIWAESSDLDPFDQVKYRLYYSTSPTFTTSVSVPNLYTTTYTTPTELNYGTTYYWKVLAQDLFNGQTFSSSVFSFKTINQGDANGDGQINIADAVFIINFIFKSGPAPDPLESGDANCDGNPNVGDAVYLVNFVFNGGPEPGCD